MIGKSVTIVRARPDMHRTFVRRGTVTSANTEESTGLVVGVCILATHTDDSFHGGWFAVGPDGLAGSLVTEQTCTVDACGHEIYGCRCA
jgi:hypothetical protein